MVGVGVGVRVGVCVGVGVDAGVGVGVGGWVGGCSPSHESAELAINPRNPHARTWKTNSGHPRAPGPPRPPIVHKDEQPAGFLSSD